MSTTQTEDERHPTSGTAQGLIDFLGYVIDNDYLNKETASGLRTGVKKVLEAESDLEAIDMKDVDLDDILHRFHNRVRGKMKDRSVDNYESRFRTALDLYLRWLDNPKDWLPASLRTRKPASNGGATKRQTTAQVRPSVRDETPEPETPSGPGIITYPFPIRAGVQGKITLPEDLTRREADRISAFIKTLAIEDEVYEHSPRAISGVVMDNE
jgi:hypothetical protein